MASLLVIGYGNPMRSDDAVGWHAARELASRLDDEETEIVALQQLTPETAEPVSEADLVVFIDSSTEGEPGTITEMTLEPASPPAGDFTQPLEPASLLACAQELYGRSPDALALSVTGAYFETGRELSPPVAASMSTLVSEVCAIARELKASRTGHHHHHHPRG